VGKLVCIGGSAGSPALLNELLRLLPNPAFPILVSLHLPKTIVPTYVKSLNRKGWLPVSIAENGMRPESGCVYFAPGGMHLCITGTGHLAVSNEPEDTLFKPSVDVLFKSAVRAMGRSAVMVVLSGMSTGQDGVQGALALKRIGGTVIVLDDPSITFLGMPRAVIDAGAATHTVPARHLPQTILDASR